MMMVNLTAGCRTMLLVLSGAVTVLHAVVARRAGRKGAWCSGITPA
jgi:2-methylisocitrate lyase-like PEP mutase family enzyme